MHMIFLTAFSFQITSKSDAARDILIDGIKHVPHSKLLLEVVMSSSTDDLSVVES